VTGLWARGSGFVLWLDQAALLRSKYLVQLLQPNLPPVHWVLEVYAMGQSSCSMNLTTQLASRAEVKDQWSKTTSHVTLTRWNRPNAGKNGYGDII